MKNEKFDYIDLFAGCGGLSLGLHNSGWKGLFAIEKSPDAFETMKHNLIDRVNHFSWVPWLQQRQYSIYTILKNYKNELKKLHGKVTLVAGGPPCQGFSLAGKRDCNDTRNKLISQYLSFIKIVEPKIIFFENVKGFTQPFGKEETAKNYFSEIKKKLDGMGYNISSKLVDFSDYGVPQSRTRIIIVGVRKEYCLEHNITPDSFFSILSNNKNAFFAKNNISKNNSINDAISDLLQEFGSVKSTESKSFKNGLYGKVNSQYQQFMRSSNTDEKIADSHRFANHTPTVVSRFKYAIDNKLSPKEYRKHFRLKKSGTKLLNQSEPTPTLTTLPDDYIHFKEPRILTVREYARIQSFPDSFIFKGKYTTGGKRRVQEVPRYSQIGNAIPPLFAEQAGLALKELIS